MARGWESKSVEEQQAQLSEKKSPVQKPRSLEELEKQRRRDGLELSRARLLNQLQAAKNPRHRLMLEHALADVESALALLG